MTVQGSGGLQGPFKGQGPFAAEPTNEGTSIGGAPAAHEEVSDFETAALEQAVDMFQQSLSAEHAPIEPLAFQWPEMPSNVGDGAPQRFEPPRREA